MLCELTQSVTETCEVLLLLNEHAIMQCDCYL